ncbi:hypothetical protein [Rhodoblastus sp.]|uniref:hypothetical protein n=1 Tax=Rhodoblastus sp. TaxID=1962975 RepID=UPI003F9C2938
MFVFDHAKTLKSCRNGIVVTVLGLGMIAGVAEAAPVSPSSLQEGIQTPIEKTVVVVHHRRPVVVHHRRRQVCWWSRGRRICRWR